MNWLNFRFCSAAALFFVVLPNFTFGVLPLLEIRFRGILSKSCLACVPLKQQPGPFSWCSFFSLSLLLRHCMSHVECEYHSVPRPFNQVWNENFSFPELFFNKMEVAQRVEIVLLMAKLESVTLVRRELQKRKWTNIPHENTIRNLFKKFKDTGSVQDAPRSGRPSLDETKSEEISEIFQNQPSTSIRQAASAISCSYGYVHKVLKHDLKLFPYKIQVTQELHEEDFSLRVSMCETLLEKTEEDENFLEKIIFSDESTFRLDGIVNRHNCRIWGEEKPGETFQRSHSSPKVNVWMGISSQRIHGPFFFDGNITGENYLDMLQRSFLPQLSRFEKRQAFFQQDGAPPHYAKSVRKFLDDNFNDRWIGRCGPLVWTARSPDLSPLDFFVWGFLKTKVFSLHPRTLQELKDCISDASEEITPDMCRSAIVSFKKRLQKCIDAGGTNVEQ